jgi:alpha-ketoglutarate-dependent taurine dioxygenase
MPQPSGVPPVPATFFKAGRRVAADAREADYAPLQRSGRLPCVASPNVAARPIDAEWRTSLRRILHDVGGVLFRDTGLTTADELQDRVRAISGPLMTYTYASTPRRHVGQGVYTSTEYPADRTIPMHNEMSYSRHWPREIYFCCTEPAASGGATPIADSRAVYAAIDPAIRRAFERDGVMYVRNYGTGLDLSWQDVFGTTDRARVETFCADAGIGWEWTADNGLRTWQVCQATAVHPVTGQPVWFNQAHLFHHSSLDDATREALAHVISPRAWPRTAFYGDGTEIESSVLDEIRAAFAACTVRFEWQRADLLVLDNMLVAHGRDPFTGPRRVLVAMTGDADAGADASPAR